MFHTTYVFAHRNEAQSRAHFTKVVESVTDDTQIAAYGVGNLLTVIDAVRLALNSNDLDNAEKNELAHDLLEHYSWDECLATFEEWDMQIDASQKLVAKN